jgi:hypothetical protein
VRRILCIPQDVSNQVMRVTAGRVLEEVVSDIYLMGAKPVGEYEAERVDNTIRDLQIDRCVFCVLGCRASKRLLCMYVCACSP